MESHKKISEAIDVFSQRSLYYKKQIIRALSYVVVNTNTSVVKVQLAGFN